MWNKLFIISAVLLGVSCQTLQDTYQEQWRPQLGEKEREQIEKFNQEPKFFKENKVYSHDEVVEYIDEATSMPDQCAEMVGDDKTGDPNIPALDRKNLATPEIPNPEELLKPLGNIPNQGGPVRYALPNPGDDTQKVVESGYYLYGESDGKTYGTERTIWRIQAAGKLLTKQGVVMAVGDISSRGGRTTGHAEHQGGNDVDLRLISPTGQARPCSVGQSCYDRDKTYLMIKTLIDVDPQGFDKVLINDEVLRAKINQYAREKYGIRNAARYCKGHDNHVHFSWKGG